MKRKTPTKITRKIKGRRTVSKLVRSAKNRRPFWFGKSKKVFPRGSRTSHACLPSFQVTKPLEKSSRAKPSPVSGSDHPKRIGGGPISAPARKISTSAGSTCRGGPQSSHADPRKSGLRAIQPEKPRARGANNYTREREKDPAEMSRPPVLSVP